MAQAFKNMAGNIPTPPAASFGAVLGLGAVGLAGYGVYQSMCAFLFHSIKTTRANFLQTLFRVVTAP